MDDGVLAARACSARRLPPPHPTESDERAATKTRAKTDLEFTASVYSITGSVLSSGRQK
jgi:hypothetical protein